MRASLPAGIDGNDDEAAAMVALDDVGIRTVRIRLDDEDEGATVTCVDDDSCARAMAICCWKRATSSSRAAAILVAMAAGLPRVPPGPCVPPPPPPPPLPLPWADASVIDCVIALLTLPA